MQFIYIRVALYLQKNDLAFFLLGHKINDLQK